MSDITSHLNALNLQLQGWGRVTTDMLQGELLELKIVPVEELDASRKPGPFSLLPNDEQADL